jgi:hypothetical protein
MPCDKVLDARARPATRGARVLPDAEKIIFSRYVHEDYLTRESENGKKPVKSIVFTGERFDVMSVWRETSNESVGIKFS